MAEPPLYFLEGHNRFPEDVETLEAGSNFAHNFPRLELGKYIGVVSAPAVTANFEPDLLMLYCNSAQLNLLLLGAAYKDGRDITGKLSGHAACVYSVVPAILSGECHVAIPCYGDRYFAIAGDDEVIFTLPEGEIEDLLIGLRHIEKYGSKLPMGHEMRHEPELPDSYIKIAGILGMR